MGNHRQFTDIESILQLKQIVDNTTIPIKTKTEYHYEEPNKDVERTLKRTVLETFLFCAIGNCGEKSNMSLSIPGEFSTFQILRNGVYSFSKGFADSLRGAIELFFLDYKRAQQREQKLQQRDIDKELLLNRNSPVREIQNIAKRRALERREKERLRETSGNKQKKAEPTIMERTLKCCVLNGGVFG